MRCTVAFNVTVAPWVTTRSTGSIASRTAFAGLSTPPPSCPPPQSVPVHVAPLELDGLSSPTHAPTLRRHAHTLAKRRVAQAEDTPTPHAPGHPFWPRRCARSSDS